MESTKKKVITTIHAPLRDLTEEFISVYTGGVGADATFVKRSKGWFYHFEGSYEAIHVGFDRPKVKIGSMAKITIEIPEES